MKPTHYYIIRTREIMRLAMMTVSLVAACGSVLLTSSCSSSKAPQSQELEEDLQAKQSIQGVWINEDQGNCAFKVKGDTIYYTDSLSEPVRFRILADTLYLENSSSTKYQLLKMTEHTIRFINSDGDEVMLTKTNAPEYLELFEKSVRAKVNINQGVLIKRDTILTANDKRFHAYSQVNPTTYKVLRQTVNEEGVSVDQAFYDNIVHIAVYDGAKKLLSRDYRKDDFAAQVPKEYLSRCILSDITIEKATSEGVFFMAILTEPDSYTSYRVSIIVDANGKVRMSI